MARVIAAKVKIRSLQRWRGRFNTMLAIFAVVAGNSGQSLWLFLLISVPARLLRFVILTHIAAGASRVLSSRFSIRSQQAIHLSCWVLFYIAFFWLMPN